jgi:hypothetical protein
VSARHDALEGHQDALGVAAVTTADRPLQRDDDTSFGLIDGDDTFQGPQDWSYIGEAELITPPNPHPQLKVLSISRSRHHQISPDQRSAPGMLLKRPRTPVHRERIHAPRRIPTSHTRIRLINSQHPLPSANDPPVDSNRARCCNWPTGSAGLLKLIVQNDDMDALRKVPDTI